MIASSPGCTVRNGPVTVESLSDMAPDASPGKTADLILGGTTYPVDIRLARSQGQMTLDLAGHGEILESERYGVEGQTFGLLDAAEEHFKPMLPLLKFPMHTGDAWSWSGSLTTGGISRPATAAISTANERIFAGGVSHETVRSTVDISMEANPGKQPVQRQLIFWFEPKAGVIKRQFGAESIRQPPQK
jgi:hypothetical protein